MEDIDGNYQQNQRKSICAFLRYGLAVTADQRPGLPSAGRVDCLYFSHVIRDFWRICLKHDAQTPQVTDDKNNGGSEQKNRSNATESTLSIRVFSRESGTVFFIDYPKCISLE